MMALWLLPVIIASALLLLVWRTTRHRAITGMFLGALLYYYGFLFTVWSPYYSPDIEAHQAYVQDMMLHWRLPPPELGAAARHPPGYYTTAAALESVAPSFALDSIPMLFARQASMLFYGLYVLFAALTLQLLMHKQRAGPYYLALGLIVFWPLSPVLAQRLNCDLMLYAGQMACLYALSYWCMRRHANALAWAFIAAGMAILGKNSGVLILGIALVVWAVSAVCLPDKRRELISWRMAGGMLFAAMCWWLTYRHSWVIHHVEAMPGMGWMSWVQVILGFNPFLLLYDTQMGLSREYFWNIWLSTLLLGDALPWQDSDLRIWLQVFWCVVLFYIVMYLRLLVDVSWQEKIIYAVFVCFVGTMTAAMMYMYGRTGNSIYSDARYVYPASFFFILVFVRIIQQAEQLQRHGVYRLGIGIGYGFLVTMLLWGGVQIFLAV